MKISPKKSLQEKIDVEQRHNAELKKELKDIYYTVKDFTVDAVATDAAIKKMTVINSKIKASGRRIVKMNLELEKL